jgi:phage baseplate assembly protein W
MDLDFPFRIDRRGRTARTAGDEHVRDLIEQFLFTEPQERVNRPEFGAGLGALVFEPNSEERAAALELRVQSGLLQWLGDLIDVRRVEVHAEEATLHVVVEYVVRRSSEARTGTFERSQA